MIRTRLIVVFISLAAFLVSAAGAEARTVKHRSWKGYTVCYSHKVKKKGHRRAHRCFRHRSHQYKVRKAAVRYALAQRGKPYIWGGTGPRGYDCSGLIYAAYRHAGKYVPRTTYAMLGGLRYHGGKLRLGDMMFRHRGHVVMYIGHGRVVAARYSGTRITTQPARYHRGFIRSPRF